MKKCVLRSESPIINDYFGLVWSKKALYMSENGVSSKITNVIDSAKPFSKLRIDIKNWTKIESMADSQTALDSGIAPDMITQNSPIIQPRKGFVRLWKQSDNNRLYLQFLDTYNEITVGRPTESIATATWWPKDASWDYQLKYALNFFKEDMSQGYAIDLFNGYFYNNTFTPGQLEYLGETLDLEYLDITISWCRITDPNSAPLTWVVLDNGYTAEHWVPIPENSTYAAWTDSIMAQRFATQYTNSYNHFDQIIENNPTMQEVYINGVTEINLGIGDIKLFVETSNEGNSISFSSKNDLKAKNYLLVCKVIGDNGARIFSPNRDSNNNVYFDGNTKLEIMSSTGTSSVKQEAFINMDNKKLTLITEKLF